MTGANVAYGSPHGDLGKDPMSDILDEQREQKEKEESKKNLNSKEQQIVNKYTAMASADKEQDPQIRFFKRHAAITGIITSEVTPHLNQSQRSQRIDELARGSVPLVEIDDIYSRAKNVIQRTAGINRYTANVVDQSKPTRENLLSKQLDILEWRI